MNFGDEIYSNKIYEKEDHYTVLFVLMIQFEIYIVFIIQCSVLCERHLVNLFFLNFISKCSIKCHHQNPLRIFIQGTNQVDGYLQNIVYINNNTNYKLHICALTILPKLPPTS
jgi:hypothetical protein